jgi:hypothetical protein
MRPPLSVYDAMLDLLINYPWTWEEWVNNLCISTPHPQEDNVHKIVDTCNSDNPCPAIWSTDNDNELVIQGYIPDDATHKEVSPPAGESIVRVPKSMLIEYAMRLLNQGDIREGKAS